MAIASLNPYTKAAFNINVTSRRFAETKVLLERGQDASITLGEPTTQTAKTAQEISTIQDQSQETKLTQDLHQDIGKYIVELSTVQPPVPALPQSTKFDF